MTLFQRTPGAGRIIAAGMAVGLLSASTAFAAIVAVDVTGSDPTTGLYTYSATVTLGGKSEAFENVDGVEFTFFTAESLPELPSITSPFGWSSGIFAVPATSGQSVLRYTFDRVALNDAVTERDEADTAVFTLTALVPLRRDEVRDLDLDVAIARTKYDSAVQSRNEAESKVALGLLAESESSRLVERKMQEIDGLREFLDKLIPDSDLFAETVAEITQAEHTLSSLEADLESAEQVRIAAETSLSREEDRLVILDNRKTDSETALDDARTLLEAAMSDLDAALVEQAAASRTLADLGASELTAGGKSVSGFVFATSAAPAAGTVRLTRADGTDGLVDTQVPGSPSPVPLPASLPLLLAGLFAMGALRRSRLSAS